MNDARLKIEPMPALSFKTLHSTVRMFLESMYGQENLLLWNYTGSCVVPCVKRPNDTDIIVLVNDRIFGQRLTVLPELVEEQPEYDHDYIVRYTLAWFSAEEDKQQLWDLLIMDDADKYADWLMATQLLIALDLPDKIKRKVLYQAVLGSEHHKAVATATIHSRIHTRVAELVKIAGDNNG